MDTWLLVGCIAYGVGAICNKDYRGELIICSCMCFVAIAVVRLVVG